jgi:DNA-directed RNA polymerase specialized sigma24 family protein
MAGRVNDEPHRDGLPGGPRPDSVFATTHWSVVLAAQDACSEQAAEALAQLCRTYWYPLYVFIRRRGYDAHDAQDLTQEFFYRLLDRSYLSAVDFRKGRFRSFLLAALDHFLANEWRNARTQRRGGGIALISINDETAESRYLNEPSTNLSPERIFDQRWALALLERVLGRLRNEFADAGKAQLFESLKVFLTGDKRPVPYTVLASETGSKEAALKMAVSRMRQRYGELLRDEIAQTVSGPAEAEDELHALFAALG